MSLWKRVKAFLGIGTPGEPPHDEPVGVTVERYDGTVDDEGETASDLTPTTATSDEADESATAIEREPTSPPAVTEIADGPVSEISGIGPAYSERLADVDITTISELAEMDASVLSTKIDVAETLVKQWIDAARDRTDVE